MRKLCRLKIILAAATLVLAACGKSSPPNEAKPSGADAGPAMWRISDDDSSAYLFGTFHILPKETQWMTPAIETAMRETPITITEVDAKSPAAQAELARLVQELGLNPPGVTLTGLLGPTRAVRFAAITERYGLPMAMFEPMKPWLAMIALSVAIMQKEGFDADSGAEETILKRADEEKDEISHLESAEYQLRALASLSEEEILADFDASLQEYEDFSRYADRMLSAWTGGDIGALEEETLSAMRKKAPDAFRILITDRNQNWAREIEAMMAGNEDYFIAVGAGHLIGEGSVVDLLRDRGFKVERVQ